MKKKLNRKQKTVIQIIAAVLWFMLMAGCAGPAAQDLKTKADVSLAKIHQAATRIVYLSDQVTEPPEVGEQIRHEAETILTDNDKVGKVVQAQHERIVWLEEALAILKKLGWFDYLVWGGVTIGIVIAAWRLKIKALYYLSLLPTVSIIFGLAVSFVLQNLGVILLIAAILIAVIVIAWLNREKIKEWDIIEDLVRHNEKVKKQLTPVQDEVIYGSAGEHGLMGTQKDITKAAVKAVKGKQ